MPSEPGPQATQVYTFAVIGSRGDIYPMLAIAQEIQRRGHSVRFATLERFRGDVEKYGLEYWLLRPETEVPRDPSWSEAELKRRSNAEYPIRERLYGLVEETYRDLLVAADGADALIFPFFLFPGAMVAETYGIPYATVYFTAGHLNSIYDPPMLPDIEWLHPLQRRSLLVSKAIHALSRWYVARWAKPFHRLREREGFPRLEGDPLLETQHSPWLTLGLFSSVVGTPQPDWPKPTVVSGFPFLEDQGEVDREAMERFLESGPPPIVATLGSSTATERLTFCRSTIAAAKALKQRLFLIAGDATETMRGEVNDPEVFVTKYASYAEVFPRASCLVIAGSIGPVSHALRTGKPMLILASEHASDQPDNAARCVRAGVAQWMQLREYSLAKAVEGLRSLLEDKCYFARAKELREVVMQEDGVKTSCDALEAMVARRAAEVPA